ncbi:MAG: transcriptional repressor NrdR [Deltaproteobacteria bacterium]|nr:transcriptional repressor NrdR [Deltaproteobacteria bacterium]MBW2305496.1 transcriptional repressor NrdR [Deltaproteobacteria bacterium]
MKCPACGTTEDKVIDSRVRKNHTVIRRRRECLHCRKRFTTYEQIEDVQLYVIKKDGRRELFDRNKIIDGMQKACEKRPISVDRIESFVDSLEQEIQETGEKEIPAALVGERVMQELHSMDDVAYVRFASVYRQFKDIDEFMTELSELLEQRRRGGRIQENP